MCIRDSLLAHVGHLRDTAGVIGDRAVSVGGQGNAQGSQHTDGGQADAVEAVIVGVAAAGQEIAGQNGSADDDHRKHGGKHSQGQAADDDGSGTGAGGARQLLGRLIGIGGVIFGDHTDENTSQQAGKNGERCV